MKKLQALKVYFTLGSEAYNVVKRWQDEPLQEKVIKILSSEYFKSLSDSNKNETYEVLNFIGIIEDISIQSILLDNIFKLIKDKNLNHRYYYANCLDLICDNPSFDVTTAYDLEKNPDMNSETIYRVVKFASMGIPQMCYFEAKKWKEKANDIMEIFDLDNFKNMPNTLKDTVCLKLEEILADQEINMSQKSSILEKIYQFFHLTPSNINASKFYIYLKILLEYPKLGFVIWDIMHIADKFDKNDEDVRKWLNIYAELYIKDEVDSTDFYSIVFNDKLMAYGALDNVINGILISKIPKSELTQDIKYLLDSLDFKTAINVIQSLFKMPSKKHYDLVGSAIYRNEVIFSNRLLDFIEMVIKMPEDKLDELKHNMEYEVVYQEMSFSKAVVEYNTAAMDYLDSHSNTKSTSLVRIPIWRKRDKYKI